MDGKEILAEADRLDIKEKAPLILANVLFGEDMVKEIELYRTVFLRVSVTFFTRNQIDFVACMRESSTRWSPWVETGAFPWRVGGGKILFAVFYPLHVLPMWLATVSTQGLCLLLIIIFCFVSLQFTHDAAGKGDHRAQKLLLGGFEHLVGVQYSSALMPKAAVLLKKLYDCDILEEEVLLDWHAKVKKT